VRTAVLVAALLLAGCGGGGGRSPEQVARAWSAALDRNDNEAAARLFAADAEVVQNGLIVLATHHDALVWNAALPCGGRIVAVQPQEGGRVLVVFDLTERPGHRCDAPGRRAAALFRVAHGKIDLWHQVPPPATAGGESV
jgi:limonene-1,2-epoxide hydrolase